MSEVVDKEKNIEKNAEPSGPQRADGGSVLDNLKRKRQKIAQDRHLDLDIPGYDGEIFARYKPVDWDRLKSIAEKAENSSSRRKELNAQADTIATACDTLFIRVEGEPEPIPLHEAYPEVFGDFPAKYDSRLGKLLGFEAETGRQAVLRLFNNDLAVTAHQNELGTWQQSSRSEDDESF